MIYDISKFEEFNSWFHKTYEFILNNMLDIEAFVGINESDILTVKKEKLTQRKVCEYYSSLATEEGLIAFAKVKEENAGILEQAICSVVEAVLEFWLVILEGRDEKIQNLKQTCRNLYVEVSFGELPVYEHIDSKSPRLRRRLSRALMELVSLLPAT